MCIYVYVYISNTYRYIDIDIDKHNEQSTIGKMLKMQ